MAGLPSWIARRPRAAAVLATAAAAIALGMAERSAPASELNASPNIVFIFSDDHAYQAIGAYGDPRRLIETPNIDRIAAEGMRFDRCLVTNSICGPSRATILTGKYSHANGFYNNTNSRFDGGQDTFTSASRARALAERARRTTTNPVVYVELPGAQHSFDLLSSIRLEAVVDGIEAFLESVAVRDGVGETTGPATGLAECHN